MTRRRTRRIALAAGAALLLGAGATAGTAPAAQAADWTTVYSDGFDGPAGSDPAGWTRETGPGSTFGTGEIETMTADPANLSLDGAGSLKITPLRDGNGNWTSGRITTDREDFAAPAGGALRMSARITMADVTGAAAEGYFPAFWALGAPLRHGTSWPSVGEIDTVEQVNGNDLAYGTLHCGTLDNGGGPCHEYNGRGGNVACPGSACSGNAHTYSVELDRSTSPEQLRWYVDGQQYWQVSESDVGTDAWNAATHHGFFMILNLAMGGNFPTGVAGHATPNAGTEPGHSMYIDQVTVETRG